MSVQNHIDIPHFPAVWFKNANIDVAVGRISFPRNKSRAKTSQMAQGMWAFCRKRLVLVSSELIGVIKSKSNILYPIVSHYNNR